MSHRALGAQFKQRLADKASEYIAKKMDPIHQAIIRQGDANKPGIDAALANWDKAWQQAGNG